MTQQVQEMKGLKWTKKIGNNTHPISSKVDNNMFIHIQMKAKTGKNEVYKTTSQ